MRKWIDRQDIEPLYKVPYKRGMVSYFPKGQMYEIGLFEAFTKLGIRRNKAQKAVKAFNNKRCADKREPDYVTIKVIRDSIVGVTLTYGDFTQIEFDSDVDAAYTVNFKKIFDEINSKFAQSKKIYGLLVSLDQLGD